MCNVGENGVFHGCRKGVGVGFCVGSGCHAKETVFGVDRPKPAVFSDSEPGDIVADAPDFIAFFLIKFRRDKHCKVGFSASGRECGGDIFDFTFGVFDSEDEHMFSHPAFFPALPGSDS